MQEYNESSCYATKSLDHMLHIHKLDKVRYSLNRDSSTTKIETLLSVLRTSLFTRINSCSLLIA